MNKSDLKHGKVSTYNNHGCRCDECREAASRYQRSLTCVPLDSGDPRHGKVGTYNSYGCRCELCKAASKAYQAQAYQKRQAKRLAERIAEPNWDAVKCPSCGR